MGVHAVTDDQLAYLARRIGIECALRSRGLRKEDAEDLRSYAWEQCLRRASRWDASRGRWTTFAVTIARNAARDGRKWLWRQWERGRATPQENEELNGGE